MPGDNGFFQLNDVVLNIPPQQISVERQSATRQWQTIRTRSSIKSRSGFSIINITARATFTTTYGSDGKNGLHQLRDLVSQFMVTPFCYVENQVIRNAVLGGSTEPTMALALRQMQIIKDASSTNTVTVLFRFSWFNYFPFLREWRYKKNIFTPDSVKDPRQSTAWKLMYRAEQERGSYSKISSFTGDMKLGFQQFASVSVKKYRQLEREVEILRNLLSDLREKGSNFDSEIPFNQAFSKRLIEDFGSEREGKAAKEEMFGHLTSMGVNDAEELIAIIKKDISPGTKSKYDVIVNNNEWTPVPSVRGGLMKYKSTPQAGDADVRSDDIMLLQRDRQLNLKPAGLIVTGLSISFENVLAELPLMGHPYPTYQHIGSIDAVVSVSIMTTSESSIQAISNFYSVVEDQALKYRGIPEGQRNIKVQNELVNMCGLRDFIPTSLTIDTVEGQPGTYEAVLQLMNNPITAETREAITPSSPFVTTQDIRSATSKILLDNLKLVKGALEPDSFKTHEVEVVSFHESRTGETFAADLIGSREERSGIALEPLTGFYIYAPKGKNVGNDRNKAFRSLCETYGRKLGLLWAKLVEVLQEMGGYAFIGPVNEFYSLTDAEVPGIERIQEDMVDVFKNNKYGKLIGTLDTKTLRQKAKERVATSAAQGLRNIQTVEQYQRDSALASNAGHINRVATKINEDVQDEQIDRVSNFVSEYLNDWLTWSQNFLDSIIYGGYVSLDQFRTIRAALEANSLTQASSGCYPDFPIANVVALLQQSNDPEVKQAIKELREAKSKGDFGLRQATLDILIQPDFYMYNRQTDNIASIIPIHVQDKAVEVIVENQRLREDSEVTWIEEEYEAKILGSELRAQIKQERNDRQFNKTWWSNSKNASVVNAIDSLLPQTRAVFHIDDLVDMDHKGLGNSILEEYEATGDDRGPIQCVEISNKAFGDYGKRALGSMTHRERGDELLYPNSYQSQAAHRFGYDSIVTRPPSAYTRNAFFSTASTEDPDWGPVTAPGMKITSFYGTRNDPVIKKETGKSVPQSHFGIDFGGFGANNRGMPVIAPADGWVISVNREPFNPNKNYGDRKDVSNKIVLRHNNGWITDYRHLEFDNDTRRTYERFWVLNNGEIAGADTQGVAFQVTKGEVIGNIGNSGLRSTGPHLHFGVKKNGKRQDPFKVPGLGAAIASSVQNAPAVLERMKTPLSGLNPANESLFTKSVNQLEKDLSTGQGYSLMRAYPTFRLFFIESDDGERRRFGFDDFFNYSSVESIKVIRSRKIAADLAIINMTNVSGVLSNRKFRNIIAKNEEGEYARLSGGAVNNGIITREDPGDPRKTNTGEENPISSLMLKPGVQIQLRLGYSNHPDDLENVFNGVITDVQFNESDDMVQIICQSFAIELVQNQHGKAKTFGGFLSSTGRTGALLEQLMAFPEVVHFGRWTGGNAKNTARGILKDSWKFVPFPQDDNIFAPTGRGIFGLFDSTAEYILYQTTLWDVFQEMTLRHPSYVACPVPYDGKFGPRMTMFFGVPDQLYFARDPTFKEDIAVGQLKQFIQDAESNLRNSNSTVEAVQDPSKEPDPEAVYESMETQEDAQSVRAAREFWLKGRIRNFAMDQGYIKPFRNYHVATSTQHILLNNIESSSNVFNTCTIQYGDDAPDPDEKRGELIMGDLETFTLRCDAAVPDEEVKEMFAQYPNCIGYEMAKRYSVGLLFYSLKECYRGNMIMVGNPKIKPYDIVYIFDEYSDMFGPIEVEQVVHEISQTRGFVTEVTPDMVVHVNQMTTLSTSDAMGLMAEHALKSIGLQSMPSLLTATNKSVGAGALAAGSAATAAAGATTLAAISGLGAAALAFDVAFTPIANMFFNSSENSLSQGTSSAFGLLGTFIFKKLITRSQIAHPFRYSPLVKNGKAMVGALPIHKTRGTFVQGIRKWAKEADEGIGMLLEDFYEKVSPNNWLGKGQGDWKKTLFGETKG